MKKKLREQLNFLFARLKEPSTWVGIFVFVNAFFSNLISEQYQTRIMIIGTGIASAYLFFIKENKNGNNKKNLE